VDRLTFRAVSLSGGNPFNNHTLKNNLSFLRLLEYSSM